MALITPLFCNSVTGSARPKPDGIWHVSFECGVVASCCTFAHTFGPTRTYAFEAPKLRPVMVTTVLPAVEHPPVLHPVMADSVGAAYDTNVTASENSCAPDATTTD